MADYVIKVDYADLDKAASDFNTRLGEVKKITVNMMKAINDAGVTWTGEASSKYLSKFNALQDDMDKMHKMIGEHVSDLQTMSKKYKATEEATQQLASKLKEDVF